jgi:hypothetical protein
VEDVLTDLLDFSVAGERQVRKPARYVYGECAHRSMARRGVRPTEVEANGWNGVRDRVTEQMNMHGATIAPSTQGVVRERYAKAAGDRMTALGRGSRVTNRTTE